MGGNRSFVLDEDVEAIVNALLEDKAARGLTDLINKTFRQIKREKLEERLYGKLG